MRNSVNTGLLAFAFSVWVCCSSTFSHAQTQNNVIALLGIEEAIKALPIQIETMTPQCGKQLTEDEITAATDKLLSLYAPQALLQQLLDSLNNQQNLDFQRAEKLLQQPIAVRIRNFEIGMQLSAATEKLERSAQTPPTLSEERTVLLRKIDTFSATTDVSLLIQQALEKSCVNLTSAAATHFDNTASEKRKYTQKLTLLWYAQAYRFLKDEELEDYITLLNKPSIQKILSSSKAILATHLNTISADMEAGSR